VRFGKGDRKIDMMQPYLQAQAATGRSGVAAVGVSQEFQRVWSAYQRDTRTAAPAVHLLQGRPQGDLLLLLPVG
jgi:hypothetical protein